VLLTLGYASQRVQIALALVGYGALLEMLQTLAPGRESKLSDACASAAGAILGVLVGMLAARYRHRSEARPAERRGSPSGPLQKAGDP
jgi:VanZ family protein